MSFVSFAAIFFGILSVVCSQGIEQKTSFIFFNGTTADQYVEYPFDQAASMLSHPNFNKTRNTTLCLHGNNEDPFKDHYRALVGEYLIHRDENIIMLNYNPLVNQTDVGYVTTSVPNAMKFVEPLALKIDELFDKGLNIDTFHLLGHSLGGQLSGWTARKIKQRPAGRKIKRITGLDPAGPPFYPWIPFLYPEPLNKEDAVFVQIIHTNAQFYGYPVATGHADFWPNGELSVQPGCDIPVYLISPDDLCSHHRSIWLFAESVSSKEPVFHSVATGSWAGFIAQIGTYSGRIANMGIDCQRDISGEWYLQTNGASPFSRGMAGTRYSSTGK